MPEGVQEMCGCGTCFSKHGGDGGDGLIVEQEDLKGLFRA